MQSIIRESLLTESSIYTPETRKDLLAALAGSDFGTT